MNTFYTLR